MGISAGRSSMRSCWSEAMQEGGGRKLQWRFLGVICGNDARRSGEERDGLRDKSFKPLTPLGKLGLVASGLKERHRLPNPPTNFFIAAGSNCNTCGAHASHSGRASGNSNKA
ncbi:hypothetical protein CRG98_024840 [Punica granatum]|uniref:Uncharacterized protein n=1 Tax=Punica granatum TaxID=22663 RepID=A0A2I0JER6_PUNGR|nr:hypothetical protein CRG98_024840 [Punica granatum]